MGGLINNSSSFLTRDRNIFFYLNKTLPVLLLLVVLAFSAYIRFDNITNQGMLPGDGFRYLKEARLWAQGSTPAFIQNNMYRPVSYFLQGIALTLFGDTDYSIKALHCFIDLLSILLIFFIATILTGSQWPGFFSSLLYAFLQPIVWFCRYEMLQPESTIFVLLALFFFILFDKQDKNRYKLFLYLFLSGFASGLATNTHPDLAFLGPGYVLAIILKYFDYQDIKNTIKNSLNCVLTFTLSFFTPYLIGFILFGFERVIRVFFNELIASDKGMASIGGYKSMPEILSRLSSSMMKFFFKDRYWVIVILLIGVVSIIIFRKIKKEKDPTAAYVPLILLGTYFIIYSSLVNVFEDFRQKILVPLIPLLILSMTYWIYMFCKQRLGKYSIPAFIGLFSLVFLLIPGASLKIGVQLKSPYRFVYEKLKNKVNEKNRLLVAPASIFAFDHGYQEKLYFGENAIYQFQLPLNGEYNFEKLNILTKYRNIRYVFIGKNIYRPFNKPTIPLPSKQKYYEEWLRNPDFPYSLEEDLLILDEYIRNKGGILISQSQFGSLYFLEKGNQVAIEKNIVENGSFENWEKGLPQGRWHVCSGRISRSREATRDAYSLCLEPGTKSVHVNWSFPDPQEFGKTGSIITVSIDVKSKEKGWFAFFIIANIDGKWKKINPPNFVVYSGQGEWQSLKSEFILLNEMKSMKFSLWLQHKNNEPAFVDNFSIKTAQ